MKFEIKFGVLCVVQVWETEKSSKNVGAVGDTTDEKEEVSLSRTGIDFLLRPRLLRFPS